MTWVTLATEDELSEEIGLCLLREVGLQVGIRLRRGGNGYLKSRIGSFCEMARRGGVLVLTDLDKSLCPEALIQDWLGQRTKPPELSIRVAVREIESWLLADHRAMRDLFGVKGMPFPSSPDQLTDPKQTLLKLARKAVKSVRQELLAQPGSIAAQGLGYNFVLVRTVRTSWAPERAAELSPSLRRSRQRLKELAEQLTA